MAFLTGCSSLQTSLLSGKTYTVVAYKPHDPDAVRVKVSLQNEMVYVMEGSRPLLVTPTTIGKAGAVTPTGTFHVSDKIKNKRSNTYGFWARGNQIVAGTSNHAPGSGYHYVGYPMAYWVEFKPAYGFHQGAVWPIPHSHGCLRLHPNAAPKFFALVHGGTPVNIAQRQPEDATIGRDVRRPQDYKDPDPPASYMISSRFFAPPSGPLLVGQ
jgi:lipoprotein-anchoring transpeptidase ErfK/SrfK